MADDTLFKKANLLFAGHTIEQSITALTLLAAFTFRLAANSDAEADQLVDAHAHDIKHHIRLNREEIAEARARMDIQVGQA